MGSFRPNAKPLAVAGACLLLSACAGNPFEDARVDAASPVAGEVAKVARANRAWPTFAAIPPVPKDVRPARQYGREAQALAAARSELERKTAPDTWSLSGSEDFATQARAAAGQEAAPDAAAATAAFADEQRKRATPPPPPEK